MVTRDKIRDDFAAPDTLLAGLPNSSKVKLRRSIVAQLKAETFGGTDHVDD